VAVVDSTSIGLRAPIQPDEPEHSDHLPLTSFVPLHVLIP